MRIMNDASAAALVNGFGRGKDMTDFIAITLDRFRSRYCS